MIHKETVAIEDIRRDPRIPQAFYSDTFVRSLVMVPVRSEDPIGAIGAYWAQPYLASSDDLLEALSRAAQQPSKMLAS